MKKLFPNCGFVLFLLVVIYNIADANPIIYPNKKSSVEGVVFGDYSETLTRKKIDLSGQWKVTFQGIKGERETWVPSSVDFCGEAVFERAISVDSSILSTSTLKFVSYGVNNECEVFINNIFIGRHSGGFSVFEFLIPDGVIKGQQPNTIQVIVRNKIDFSQNIPPRTQIWGWKNYNGLLRDVFLFVIPRLNLDYVNIRTRFTPQTAYGEVLIETGVKNLQKNIVSLDIPYSVVAEVFELTSNTVVASVSSVNISLTGSDEQKLVVAVPAAKPWTPEGPTLYRVKVSLYRKDKQPVLVDQYIRDVGFVSVTTEKNIVKVNGAPYTLKGVVWHEDSPDYGASLSYELMEKDIAMIKALGANAIRCAFHPPHPYIVNLCNRYGLFLFIELPVWQMTGRDMSNDLLVQQAERCARSAIQMAGAAPSVFAWGVGTYFDSADPQAELFVSTIADIFSQQDERPTYYGTSLLKNDRCASATSCLGVFPRSNDSKEFRNQLNEWLRRNSEKPTFILGYGKEVLHYNLNGYSDPLSQQAQARFFVQHYTVIKESKVAGSFIDAYADWRGEHPIMTVPTTTPEIHPRGLQSFSRQKRLAYDVIRALYSNDRVESLPIGKHKAEFPYIHISVGFFLAVIGGYLYTYNRRFSEAIRRALLRSYNFFEDVREKRGTTLFHTIILVVYITFVLALLTSSFLYYFRTSMLFDYIITFFIPFNALKSVVISMAWSPFKAIFLLSILFGLLFIAGLFLARVVSFIIGGRFLWFQTTAAIAWGSLPMVLLLPIAMVLFKLFENSLYIVPTVAISLIILLWVILRMISGISVTYEISKLRVFTGSVVVISILIAGVLIYYEQTTAISGVMTYLYHILHNTL